MPYSQSIAVSLKDPSHCIQPSAEAWLLCDKSTGLWSGEHYQMILPELETTAAYTVC